MTYSVKYHGSDGDQYAADWNFKQRYALDVAEMEK